ncbi:MAG: hypothetical protein HXY18_00665 [Bryobacteraceae bacterium]|nr:hypothetical protein [Bryobacteraceae bacterium]
MDAWMRLTLAVLAAWRLTHLVAKEDGPWDFIVRLRRGAGNSLFGRLMDCFQCLSLWMAAPFALFVSQDWLERLVAWLAISGAACLVERAGGEPEWMLPAEIKSGEGGNADELLRTEAGGGEPAGSRPTGGREVQRN